MLAALLDALRSVLPYRWAAAVTAEDERATVVAWRGESEAPDLFQHALAAARESLKSAEASVAQRARKGRATSCGPPILAAALHAGGKAVGALVVGCAQAKPPTRRQRGRLTAFACHAGVVLDAAASLRSERAARERVEAVVRIMGLAASCRNADALAQEALGHVRDVVRADAAVVYLRCNDGRLLTAARLGVTEPEPTPADLDLAQSTALRAILLGPPPQPMLFHAPALPAPVGLDPGRRARSLLLVPLLHGEELLGAIALHWRERCWARDPAAVEFLAALGRGLALGVENARVLTRLAQLASTDELTQLANRRRFTEALRLELARARRSEAPLSVVLADVDHLKRINDGFGHPAGDAAIRHVGDALKECCREIDLAARVGGEEFGLLLPATARLGAATAAQRIRHALARTEVVGVGRVTLSMGVATWPEDGSSESDLIRTADERLYHAKASGRDQVCSDAGPDSPEAGDRAARALAEAAGGRPQPPLARSASSSPVAK